MLKLSTAHQFQRLMSYLISLLYHGRCSAARRSATEDGTLPTIFCSTCRLNGRLSHVSSVPLAGSWYTTSVG